MGIPLVALASQPQPDVGQQLARAQNMKYEQQMQPLRLQLAQQQIDEQNDLMQTRIAQRQAYAQAVKPDANGQPQIDTDELQKSLATSGHGDAIPKILEGVTKYQESRADLSKKIQDLQTNSTDMIGHAAKAVQDSKYDPNVSHMLLDTMGNDPKIAQMRQLIDTNPQAFKQMVDSAVAASPAQQKLQNERDIANIRANGGAENRELNAALQSGAIKNESEWPAYKAQQEAQKRLATENSPEAIAGAAEKAGAEAKARLPYSPPVVVNQMQNAGAAADANGNPSEIAKAIANGQMAWKDAVSMRTPMATKNAILQQIYKINPNFDTSEFGLETKAAEKARSGQWADTRLAYNTALDHSDLLLQAAKALQNGDVRTLNSIKNKFNTEFGGSGQVTFDAIANAYNHEVTSVVSKGHITDSEVASGHATLPDNANFDTIKSVVGAYKGLMSSKRDELDKIIRAGAGNKANGVINTGSNSGNTPSAGTPQTADDFRKKHNLP